MSRIRILQFITPAGFYGAERWVLALANNLDPEAVTCDLAVTHESGHQDLSVATYFPTNIGKVHYLPTNGRFDWRVVSKLASVIRERNIDVIHTHGYKSDILGYLAARKAGIACVSTPHGFAGKVGLKMRAFIKLGTLFLKYFDQVAPLSEELVSDMRRFGVSDKKTTLIRNGVDLKEIDATATASSGQVSGGTGKAKRIGFVGQMIPRKGIGDLLDVFDTLYRSDPSLKLELLGDGSQRLELEAHAGTLRSASAISFLGFRSDRLEQLSRFDLFVMTSSLEGIPRCMMEAMALGIPVVAYDISGVDQLVEHEQTGLLAPLGDKVALAECCQRVLEDPSLAQALAAQARETIALQYSAARMANEYEALFARLLERQAPGKSPERVV
ncbi:MAG: glycosyltransferase family 4 protein [Marinobacter sp.]